jgi:hypothetical protein
MKPAGLPLRLLDDPDLRVVPQSRQSFLGGLQLIGISSRKDFAPCFAIPDPPFKTLGFMQIA